MGCFFNSKRILLISPEPWDHIHVSKHHYAIYLSKRGNQVIFLNPPGNKWNLSVTPFDGVKALDYPGFWKGLRFLPTWLRKKNQSNVFKKIEVHVNMEFDVVWSFDNSVFFQMDIFSSEVTTISHIVDLNMDYETALAAKTAKVCFCTSRFIRQKLESYSDHVFFINHGFNINHQTVDYTELRKSTSKKAVGYAGNLDIQYLDWILIREICQKFPEVDFYFAGSLNSESIKKYFNEISNMHYVGVLHSDQIQAFYKEMDMLIIAYRADTFKEQLANPHKMLEYLYSGKSIVSTFTDEYQKNDLIYMSNQNDEWPSLFQHVIENLDNCSLKELVDERKKFAIGNTYDKQIERIENILAGLHL